MKSAFVLAAVLAAASFVSAPAHAQEAGNAFFYQNAGPVTTAGVGMIAKGPGVAVQGAPYSATMTNEIVQTLSDGTHITQTTSGNVARDSQGRTRQDASLPAIGNLSAADAPHLVFLQDPVAQASYTLNLTDKTAEKMPMFPANLLAAGPPPGPGKFTIQIQGSAATAGAVTGPPPGVPQAGIVMQRTILGNEEGKAATQDLGTQTMEGVQVMGTRTTRTIPVGAIGNDHPIVVVNEVWTSPDLKTVVYSKRSDPRVGEQTFRLTNLVRSEPDASLFTVPPDFNLIEGPQDVLYRSIQ